MFLGYLPKKLHQEYRGYAKKSDRLHTEGYMIVSRQQFGDCNFPTEQFLTVYYKNRGNINEQRNGESYRNKTKLRSWMEFDKD